MRDTPGHILAQHTLTHTSSSSTDGMVGVFCSAYRLLGGAAAPCGGLQRESDSQGLALCNVGAADELQHQQAVAPDVGLQVQRTVEGRMMRRLEGWSWCWQHVDWLRSWR